MAASPRIHERIAVLIADDNDAARALHSRYVESAAGFTVAATAASGTAALAQCTAGIDLVLLDLRLPDISGIEVLHRLRTARRESPDVLIVSSASDRTTVRQALAGRPVGYLLKPFTRDALHARLMHYAAGKRPTPPHDVPVPYSQGDLDRLVAGSRVQRTSAQPGAGAASVSPGVALPKGLVRVTLSRVIAALEAHGPISSSEVAAACGLSRSTARRYLEHLTECGAVDIAHRYGQRGRPNVLYTLAPGA